MDFQIVYASQLKQLLRESRGILIDIREPEDYKKGHWPGAVNYPYEKFEEGRRRREHADCEKTRQGGVPCCNGCRRI